MDELVEIVRAIGEPTRVRILALLSHGEMAAGEMSTVLNQSQPRVSRHLKLLAEAELIERRPEGAWVFFRLTDKGVAGRIVTAILAEIPERDFVIARDLERLAQIQAHRETQAQAYFEAAAEEWETLRRLHQPDLAVETALSAATGGASFDFHIDLGSGTGRMLEVFAAYTKKAEGIDSSRKMLAMARARLDNGESKALSVRQGDILALPYNDQVANLVTIHQVLHYLPEPNLAISEAARVLSAEGTLLIADFAPHSFEELREKHAHRRLGFTDQEVTNWCEQSGLKMMEITHVAPLSSADGLAVTIWKAQKLAPALSNARATTTKSRSAA
jgi:ubiquinone/menaquinone biosynthesis C-methylase UbiE/DNA-binding transcriptional ArsR family regulator